MTSTSPDSSAPETIWSHMASTVPPARAASVPSPCPPRPHVHDEGHLGGVHPDLGQLGHVPLPRTEQRPRHHGHPRVDGGHPAQGEVGHRLGRPVAVGPGWPAAAQRRKPSESGMMSLMLSDPGSLASTTGPRGPGRRRRGAGSGADPGGRRPRATGTMLQTQTPSSGSPGARTAARAWSGPRRQARPASCSRRSGAGESRRWGIRERARTCPAPSTATAFTAVVPMSIPTSHCCHEPDTAVITGHYGGLPTQREDPRWTAAPGRSSPPPYAGPDSSFCTNWPTWSSILDRPAAHPHLQLRAAGRAGRRRGGHHPGRGGRFL